MAVDIAATSPFAVGVPRPLFQMTRPLDTCHLTTGSDSSLTRLSRRRSSPCSTGKKS
jgi:hypothetical protein